MSSSVAASQREHCKACTLFARLISALHTMTFEQRARVNKKLAFLKGPPIEICQAYVEASPGTPHGEVSLLAAL